MDFDFLSWWSMFFLFLNFFSHLHICCWCYVHADLLFWPILLLRATWVTQPRPCAESCRDTALWNYPVLSCLRGVRAPESQPRFYVTSLSTSALLCLMAVMRCWHKCVRQTLSYNFNSGNDLNGFPFRFIFRQPFCYMSFDCVFNCQDRSLYLGPNFTSPSLSCYVFPNSSKLSNVMQIVHRTLQF